MSVYVLIESKTNEVKAICEDKKIMEKYIKNKKYDLENDYFFIKVKKEEHVNDILVNYSNLYLYHDSYLDAILTEDEINLSISFLEEEKQRLSLLSKDLQFIIDNYELSNKEKRKLSSALKTINKIKKKKKLKKILGVDKFSKFIETNKSINNFVKPKLDYLKQKIFVFANLK